MERDPLNQTLSTHKKVLIVTYYWPPAGGPGVQRWLKFVKYLPEFGISPVVCIPKGAIYPMKDSSLCSEGEGVHLINSPISEPSRWISWLFKKQTSQLRKGMINEKNPSVIEKFLRAIRGNFFVPDARIGWVKPTTALLKEHIQAHGIETVITTGPPHSVHLIGMALKKELDICWMADFRDPWTSIGYHQSLFMSAFVKKKHKKLERHVLGTADHIITTSHTTAKEFGLLTDQPIHVITNGFEPLVEKPKAQLDIEQHMKGFSILHIGSLLSKRNPEILWKSLSELTQEHSSFKREFSLHFVGEVSEQVKARLSFYGLEKFTVYHGYMAHSTVRIFQKFGRLLLLLEVNSKQHRGIIPGKLFEYLASENPIIAIGPQQWEAGSIIKETQAGNVFTYEDKKAIKSYIMDKFSDYFTGENSVKSTGIERFHRKALTAKLSKIIHGTGN